MRKFAWVVVAALSACATPPSEIASGSVALVRSATSFGMCAGYCQTEFTIAGSQAQLIKRAGGRAPGNLPDSVKAVPVSASELDAIDAALKRVPFSELKETYGCPDCADGGAEVIELSSGGQQRVVTFEYGKPPEELRELRAAIWRIRERLGG